MPDPERIEQLVRGWGAMMAEQAGLAPGHLAEGYLRVDSQ